MITIVQQQRLALHLLEWHGGMSSGLYAVGSCMLSDSFSGRRYNPLNHKGHAEFALDAAIAELRNLRRDAKYPECVHPPQERECNDLADKLARHFKPSAQNPILKIHEAFMKQYGNSLAMYLKDYGLERPKGYVGLLREFCQANRVMVVLDNCIRREEGRDGATFVADQLYQAFGWKAREREREMEETYPAPFTHGD